MTYTPRQSVIIKTPLRVTLGGGGTDLPFYSSQRGGYLISAAIDEYISVTMASRPLDQKILVQTTATQFAASIDQVENDIVRETLRYFKRTEAIQVAIVSTIPTGIGLGSSSARIVGMVRALATLNGQDLSAIEVASIAHHIERDILGFPGGVQDQYIASLGGLQIITVEPSGKVSAQRLVLKEDILRETEHKLVLIYSGKERDSHKIIKSQEVNIQDKIKIYDSIKKIAVTSIDLLKAGDIAGFGQAMDEHWQLKKKLSGEMSDDNIDQQYLELKKMGSTGGKLVGAGGGGFFMMAVPGDVDDYIQKVCALDYKVLDWCFDSQGSHVIDQVACPQLDQVEV